MDLIEVPFNQEKNSCSHPGVERHHISVMNHETFILVFSMSRDLIRGFSATFHGKIQIIVLNIL